MKEAGQPDPIRRAAAQVVGYAEARLGLLQTEWAIEKVRLADLIGIGISMLFFSFLTVVLVVMLIIAWYWDTPMRLMVIGLATAGSLVCALLAAGLYRVKRSAPSVLFQRSIEECSHDRRAIDTSR